MKRLGRALARGLYIVWRDRLYWRTFAWFVVLVAAVFGLGAAIWTTVARYNAHDWHVFGVYVLSEFLLFLPFGPDKTKKIRDLDGEVLVWTIDAITRHGYILDLRDRMLGDALGAALWGRGRWRRPPDRSRRRLAHRSLAQDPGSTAGAAGEKRAASVPQRGTGHRSDRILRLLRAPARLVWKTAKRCARSSSAEREDTRSTVGNHHVADGAANGSERRQRSSAVPSAIGEPKLRLSESARSVRRGRADAAEAPPGKGHLQFRPMSRWRSARRFL